MMHIVRFAEPARLFFLLMILGFNLYAQSHLPKTFLINPARLQNYRDSVSSSGLAALPEVVEFLAAADDLLLMKPVSVMDKNKVPPSGTKHDFLSIGPYWWPDSSKKDGLPYIRRDGERNPEYYQYTDGDNFSAMADAVEHLSIAYYITDNHKYFQKAAQLIHTWFIDEATAMNPNMKHAQFIPGVNTGRGIGLIETREIHKIVDAIGILRTANAWSGENDKKITQWFEEYLMWITTHPYGVDESGEKNNHGTWYDVQAASIALFLHKNDIAGRILEEVKLKRINTQIDAGGRQPLELARTRSWHYSIMNLCGLMYLAMLAEKVHIDLWGYQAPAGGSLKKALDYLLPFARAPETWGYKQFGGFNNSELLPLLSIARDKYSDTFYSDWCNRIFPQCKLRPLRDMVF